MTKQIHKFNYRIGDINEILKERGYPIQLDPLDPVNRSAVFSPRYQSDVDFSIDVLYHSHISRVRVGGFANFLHARRVALGFPDKFILRGDDLFCLYDITVRRALVISEGLGVLWQGRKPEPTCYIDELPKLLE